MELKGFSRRTEMETIIAIVLMIFIGAIVMVFSIVFMALNYVKQEMKKYENDR